MQFGAEPARVRERKMRYLKPTAAQQTRAPTDGRSINDRRFSECVHNRCHCLKKQPTSTCLHSRGGLSGPNTPHHPWCFQQSTHSQHYRIRLCLSIHISNIPDPPRAATSKGSRRLASISHRSRREDSRLRVTRCSGQVNRILGFDIPDVQSLLAVPLHEASLVCD